MKYCPSCKLKLEDAFFSKGSATDGLQSYCKNCIKERNRNLNPIKLNDSVVSKNGEEWKDIPEYKNIYQVSNFGRVRSINRVNSNSYDRDVFRLGKVLKPNINKKTGYLSVMLGFKGKRKYIHRLVAEAFIPNTENKPCINHINKNRSDNSCNNIEWVTYLENNIHSKTTEIYTHVSKQLLSKVKLPI